MGRHELQVVIRPSDEPHWYALRVQPQKEYVVAYLLREQGVRTFVPTETKYRRRTRYTQSKAEFAHPEIPGCVFAGFDGVPSWYFLLKNQLIIGAEGLHGLPWRLDASKLHRYFARSQDGCMVIADGMRLVRVQGFGHTRLTRSPTTQVRIISKRNRADPVTVEPSQRMISMLEQFKCTHEKLMEKAA